MEQETVAESAESVILEYPLIKVLVYTSQLSIYPLLLILRAVIVRNNLNRDIAALNLKNKRKNANFVIYANHQSKLDPLIICASLPFNAIKHLIPFRFFVENSYFNGFISRMFLNCMGGFPAHYTEDRPYGLDKARAVMATSQTVVIFPPGRRTRDLIAKPGISILAAEPATYLIPVHIDWKHRLHCNVNVGSPIKVKATKSPDQFMQYVYDLAKNSNQLNANKLKPIKAGIRINS
jgi:1-acyl-sn-glycerol-3-phosphate acyltransferase